MAGVVNESTREKALTVLREIFPGARVRVEPDFTAAFYACPAGTDICVISGTGSLVCSVDSTTKRMNRSGGGGYLIGDEGSAFQYGRDALRHYLTEPEAASEQLVTAVSQLFGTTDPGDVVAEVYRAAAPATTLSKLAKSLIADYRTGQGYARECVEGQTTALASVVIRHIHQFGFSHRENVALCLAGGLWKGAGEIQAAFEEKLTAVMPSPTISICRIEKPPIHGALTLAHRMVTG
jgi:N-acetylglucosamine kinase-like BadF-type ATPase